MNTSENRGWMLSEAEYASLSKFHKPTYVDEKDSFTVKQLTSCGLLEMGFVLEERSPRVRETAKLTDFGAMVLGRERRMRSSVWRFLYKAASLVM